MKKDLLKGLFWYETYVKMITGNKNKGQKN